MKRVDGVEGIATAKQLVGYGLTGLNFFPRNILGFVIGIALWILVGVMWKNLGIMVAHIGALIALLAGYVNS
ncbi:MAG: DUF6552 family protein [Sulfitobacter sp.]